ncbi:hypothetical protein [Aeromonas veronii]|uniref:hypothetical protein n=1 Tax=Aeromonas veronii TaxID=654 RepID=UPI0018821D3B|nr:hypothetical protein [Aeromonas veronii]MBE8735699.1 hypothetical protein [Aeromonas veronii]MBE8739941.1 hypothetical protein [Aeromonas veronii]MBE8743553.1 hypothetical protein [Aeromonas veronii]MBE8764923.1 hypothetical protein [Aeromonas veronii]MBE8839100.1 hypothetical protein [Aeromonas veronii]
MRLGWLLLLFPSAAFAIAGCPVGVQLGNVTVATNLPVCLKFESSQLGGCIVDCKGVCVELPLANKKGPVETTGAACDWTQNSSGNGDSDGSGNTPDEGSTGTKPIDGWLDFQPVIGDATGTSVSGAVAKLNKNLGIALRQVVDSTKRDSSNINSIAHSAESFSRDMKDTLYHIKQSSSELSHVNGNLGGVAAALSTTRDYLQSIDAKLANIGSGSSSGVPSSVASDVAGIASMMGASLNMMSSIQGNTNGLNNKLDDISGNTKATSYFAKDMKDSLKNIERSLGGGGSGSGSDGGSSAWTASDIASLVESAGTTANQSEQQTYVLQDMRTALEIMAEKAGNGGNGDGNGSGDGSGVDYSKMPGSGGNPLSVKEGKYSSACSGNDCFFDVAAIQKKLDEANKAISDKYQDIGDEVRDIFDFQLSGSAGVIECFDFFTYGGKDYRVCPPAKEYWNIIAALMMFIFYFIAFAIVFKR